MFRVPQDLETNPQKHLAPFKDINHVNLVQNAQMPDSKQHTLGCSPPTALSRKYSRGYDNPHSGLLA